MKKLLIVAVVAFLFGCDSPTEGNDATPVAEPNPVTDWGNLTRVADTYEFMIPTATINDFIELGQIAATPGAVCVVLWETTTRALVTCRSLEMEGQWPADCTVNADATVSCPYVNSVPVYSLLAVGIIRTLTPQEAGLADEIRRQTYCTAPRLDLSIPPCTIS